MLNKWFNFWYWSLNETNIIGKPHILFETNKFIGLDHLYYLRQINLRVFKQQFLIILEICVDEKICENTWNIV